MNEHEREMDLALAEAEQENRLLRARNERMQTELDNAEQELHELKDVLFVERKAMADRAHTLNNYEDLIRDLTDALRGQRTWVGLTPLNIEDEYVNNYLWERSLIAIDDPCCRSHPHENMNEYCQRRTELARYQAKLKEKNT